MAKKEKMIEALNSSERPYNISVQFGAPTMQGGVPSEFNCMVNLTIMDKITNLDGRSVQPTHRIVQTTGFGSTREEAKKAALTEALQIAGVI